MTSPLISTVVDLAHMFAVGALGLFAGAMARRACWCRTGSPSTPAPFRRGTAGTPHGSCGSLEG